MRFSSFLAVVALTLGGIFPTPVANSAEQIPVPDLGDIYYPILKDLKIEVDVAAKVDANKKITFPSVAKVELKVRYHRNSTYAIEIKYAPKEGKSSLSCSYINWLRAPSNSFAIQPATTSFGSSSVEVIDKIGNRKILAELAKREKIGDWFEESFRFSTPIFENEFLEPCIATYEVSRIRLYDVANKIKIIHYKAENERIDYVAYENWDDKPMLPEFKCPRVRVRGAFMDYPTPCEDSAKIDLASFSITREMIDASVAKALNPPKVAVTPEPTKSSEQARKTTITCVKGKLTKKVTALKPKCPTGYKVKK